MFAARYFPAFFFAPRFFAEVGADSSPTVTRFLSLSTASGYLVLSQTS